MEREIFDNLVLAVIVVAIPVFLLLLRLTAPYGRHSRTGWGPTMPARLAWVTMESPAVLLFIAVYFQGDRALTPVPLVFLVIWQVHYVNRAFIYPFLRRDEGKRMPIVIVLMAISFNCINAYINARWISHFGAYGATWMSSPAMLLGVVIYVGGFAINQYADFGLRRLRKSGCHDYQIPQGGLYRFVSCPNYLGEIIEWIGWAIATWSLAGFAFALFTMANLVPRALANHHWYQRQFEDYPSERRALIPFVG